MTDLRPIWAVYPIAVDRAWTGIGQVSVPYLIAIFGKFDALEFVPAIGAKQA